jgi:hypothetical protein
MAYIVTVQFTFTARVRVEADTPEAAEGVALRHFSCRNPLYENGLCDAIQDWDGPRYPEKHILPRLKA